MFADPEAFRAEQLSGPERRMLGYYLSSGTYGTVEQSVRNKLSKLGGAEGGVSRRAKLLYVWRRLFPDRAFMEVWCRAYAPFFSRHRRLMPLAVLWRLGSKGVTNIRKWLREVGFVAKA